MSEQLSTTRVRMDVMADEQEEGYRRLLGWGRVG